MKIVQLSLIRTALLLSAIAVISEHFGPAKALQDIGVNYGTHGDNLPPATEVINLYKRSNIGKIRLLDPDTSVLEALKGSELSVSLNIRNQDLPNFASDRGAVDQWFAVYVEPYLNDVEFSYVIVGNEVIPGDLGPYVLPVMESLQDILKQRNLAGIKVTTVIPTSALSSSSPPSKGQFSVQAASDLKAILRFLSSQGSPLMINVYPYFAHASDPANIPLEYALFTSTNPPVKDWTYSYNNFFDATVDAFIWAMEKEDVTNVDIVVAESGWPSAGNGNYTTPNLAATYNGNFVKHILSHAGTPKRLGAYIEGFIFAMFNENLKPNGVEQNFGLYYPNMSPVYPLF